MKIDTVDGENKMFPYGLTYGENHYEVCLGCGRMKLRNQDCPGPEHEYWKRQEQIRQFQMMGINPPLSYDFPGPGHGIA